MKRAPRIGEGRPSKYTKELGDLICEQLGQGTSMRRVCASEEMPSMQTVFSWLRTDRQFLEQYVRAKEEAADALTDELQDIGDRAIEHAEEADFKASNAVVSAYKLKADNIKWVASKLKPKKYGDKLDLTSGGEKLPTPIMHNPEMYFRASDGKFKRIIPYVSGNISHQKDKSAFQKNTRDSRWNVRLKNHICAFVSYCLRAD